MARMGAVQNLQDSDSFTAWLASAGRACPPSVLWYTLGDAG